jgi:hypothetical protein
MFPIAGAVTKLVALGVPPSWAKAIVFLLGNPNSALSHSGPVAISLPSGQNVPTNAAMAKALPSDATKMSPALLLEGQDYEALRVNTGATNINGSGMQVGAPATLNNYVYANYPIHVFDDIRMMGLDGKNGGIFKFDRASFGGTLTRVKILSSGSGSGSGSTGSIATYQVQSIDQNGNPVGVPFIAYDPGNFVAPQQNCNSGGNPLIGWAVYVSDRAPGGPTADTSVRPNIGGWDILSCGNPGATTGLSITYIAKICCYNGKTLVCTQTANICSGGTLGPIDCGGGSCS